MSTVTPAVQIYSLDEATDPAENIIAQVGGRGISCPNGTEMQVPVLPAATSALALPFPIGVTTALVLYIAALQTTDLLVTISGTALQVPAGQALLLYSVAKTAVTVSSALGGKIQVVIGG